MCEELLARIYIFLPQSRFTKLHSQHFMYVGAPSFIFHSKIQNLEDSLIRLPKRPQQKTSNCYICRKQTKNILFYKQIFSDN